MPDPRYLVDYLQQCLREADEARKPLADLWRDAWKVFHNDFDYSKKAGFQTKLRWSRFSGTIETFAAILKRAMVEARVWHVVEGTDEIGKQRAPLIKRLLDLWLRLTNFVVLFADGLKLGGIADMIVFKATWPSWEEQDVALEEVGNELGGLIEEPLIAPKLVTRRRSGLRVELLDPFKVWLDPKGRNRYVIEESETDYDELRQMARLSPENWDSEAIGQLTSAAQTAQEQYEEARRKNMAQGLTSPWRKPVKLHTYWGDLVDEETGKVERNVTFTVANDRILVGKKRPIRYWHTLLDKRVPNKRGPLIWGFPFRIPLAPYGKGLARDNLDLAVLLTDLSNMIGDQTLFAGLNAFEVDKDLIDDPEQFKDGVYPGKTFTKVSGAGDRPLIQPRVLGQVNPQLIGVTGFFDRAYQNSTMVTSYVEPTPQAKTSTLGEYQGRQTQNLGSLDMVARNLEDQFLEPFLEMVYWLILQYMDDFTAPEVVEALGNDAMLLATMSDVERFELLKANVRFQARGMSVVLAKQEELQKVAAFINGLPQLQKIIPDIGQRINPEALLRKAIEALQWDPDEVLRNPQEIALEQEAQGGAAGITPNGPIVTPPAPAQPVASGFPSTIPMMPGGIT